MAKLDVDLMEGYDGKNYVYDEKQEKRYESRIWVGIAVCMILVLLRAASWHIEEIYMVHNWQVVEAEYNQKAQFAYYEDENGKSYQSSVEGFLPDFDGDTIKLYYETNIQNAEPVNSLSFWFGAYALCGGILAFCAWRIARIYKKKKIV